MFNRLTRDSFNVDLLIPAIQTAATFVAAQILGRMGHYTMSNQTAVLISGVASVTASFASNFFNKASLYYAALPVGIGAGVVAHTFFYPTVAINQVINVKGFVAIAAVLASVKLVVDNTAFFRRQAERVEEDLAEVEDVVLEKTERVLQKAHDHVEKKKEELEEEEEV